VARGGSIGKVHGLAMRSRNDYGNFEAIFESIVEFSG